MTFQQFVCIRLAGFDLSIRSLQKCENAVFNVFSMARPGIKPGSFGYKADALTTNPSRRGTIRTFTFGVEKIKLDAPSVAYARGGGGGGGAGFGGQPPHWRF